MEKSGLTERDGRWEKKKDETEIRGYKEHFPLITGGYQRAEGS